MRVMRQPLYFIALILLPTRILNVVANPTRLIIPAFGINTSFEQVGMLSNGDMATPTQNPWENVGWYKTGPRPGKRTRERGD